VQTEAANIKSKRGGLRVGSGCPKGHKGPIALVKIALKTLENIMQDEGAPAEARAIAACKLLDQVKSS